MSHIWRNRFDAVILVARIAPRTPGLICLSSLISDNPRLSHLIFTILMSENTEATFLQ